jgi:phage terminase large subunit GpA-like protein
MSFIPGTTLDFSLFPDPAILFDSLAKNLTPREHLPLSKWVKKHMRLSASNTNRAGTFRPFGWQVEPLDCVTDPRVEGIVGMFGTQTIKTLLTQSAVMYKIIEDPCPILMMQPNDDDARTFSKERLGPMIEDNPELKALIATTKSGATQSTIETKLFPNGSLTIVGATVPGNMARRSIGMLIGDETDKYVVSAGKEGDPIRLGMERLATYESRKKWILVCSPSIAGMSRISRAYENSDKRRPWAPCPVCGRKQILNWAQVKWDRSIVREKQHFSAYYQCEHCPAHWDDIARRKAANEVQWIAEREFTGVAGFWLSQLYAPWKKLSDMVKNFLEVKDNPPEFKVFVNTVLAELWTDDGELPDHEKLYGRREKYPFNHEAIVPARGLVLTAAVDVQDNPPRLEVEVKAWGRKRESWSLAYSVIQAFAANGQALPVSSKELWKILDEEILQRNWLHESGALLGIHAMGIDTGNRPKPVYDFARAHAQAAYGPAGIEIRQLRTVIPVKGTPDAARLISSVAKESGAHPQNNQSARILLVGTHYAKREIYDLLRSVIPVEDGTLSGAPTPGCYHHPDYSRDFFESLTAEVRVIEPNGKVKYKKIRDRNEALDLAVYNRAMAAAVGIDRWNEEQWKAIEDAITHAPKVATIQVAPIVTGVVLDSNLTASAEAGSNGSAGDDLSPSSALPAEPKQSQLQSQPFQSAPRVLVTSTADRKPQVVKQAQQTRRPRVGARYF